MICCHKGLVRFPAGNTRHHRQRDHTPHATVQRYTNYITGAVEIIPTQSKRLMVI